MYIDLCCCVYVTFTIIIVFVFDSSALPGSVGFIISNSIQLVNLLQWAMRQTTELEGCMTSVERIEEYTKLEEEPPFESESGTKLKETWPEEGDEQSLL